MSVTYEFFIGMSWKIFQVSHVSHMSQKKKTEKNRLGTTRKSIQLDFLGIITSFLTNFKPSSIDCNKPK